MALNVLITGANSGFGLLTARRFAEAGHRVHAGYRNPDKAGPLRDLKEGGFEVTPLALDVTKPDEIAAAVATAEKAGPIDVLVNNAGFEIRGPVEALSDDLLRRQFETNVFGVVRLVRAVAPAMRARGRGVIINLSSVAGHLNAPFASAYSASKHAVEAFSEALWFELRPFGVKVVLIEPGGFETAFSDNILTAPEFGETSPYAPLAARFSTALEGLFADGPPQDPQEVAELIFQVAQEEDPKLRHLAGADAKMLVPLYRSQEFEAYATLMLNRLGLTDVVKPPAAS